MEMAKTPEVAEIKKPNSEGFREIKPETEITTEEAKGFLNNLFNPRHFDDNGQQFRDRDHLFPNTKYEVNGYQYETDGQGRVISAEGQLRMRDPEYGRNMESVREREGQEYKSTDEQGHLIGHQFGGSDRLENLVPMDKDLNRGDFEKLENSLASAVIDGAQVNYKVEPVYETDSTRPSEFRVSYSIDGDRDVVVFKNESGAEHDE